MRNNYKAWNIEVNDFFKITSDKDKIKFIVGFGILAPSSHNSQPWSFSIEKNIIHVYKEENRRLPVGDVNDRLLYISIGCAIENILIAADYFGYTSEIKFNSGNSVVSVTLSNNGLVKKENKEHQIFIINRRTVNRGKYLNKEIDNKILDTIKNLESSNLKINIITEEIKKNKLADIALAATSDSMSSKEFRKELAHHVISNTSSKKIGMPGFTLGFPTLVSYIAPIMLKIFNLSKLSNKDDEKILKKFTPYMLIISTTGDDLADWIATGRTFQKISLITTAEEISLGVWAAPILIGNYYNGIKDLLGIDCRPQFFFRMGYALRNVKKHSPRLTVDDVIRE